MHRDANIDGLKFLLIFLVVLGHINEPNYSALPTRLIYSFHMPVFIFLSGYLTSVHTDLKKLLMWTLKLGCIYLLAGTSLNLLSWATDRPVSTAQWLLLKPQFAMWYLLALIYWRWAIYLLHDNISTERIFAGSICLALLIGFIPASIDTGLLAIHRTITFLPCFTLGYWFRHEQRFVNVLSKIPPPIFISTIVISFIISTFLPVYIPSYHYVHIRYVALFIVQTGIGIIVTLSIFGLSRRLTMLERFATYGRYTLWVYIGHTFCILLQNFYFKSSGKALGISTAIGLGALYTMGITCLAVQFTKKRPSCGNTRTA